MAGQGQLQQQVQGSRQTQGAATSKAIAQLPVGASSSRTAKQLQHSRGRHHSSSRCRVGLCRAP